MKQITILLSLLLIVLISNSKTLSEAVQFASVDEAKKMLTTEDNYTKSWSQFDIDSRVQKKEAMKSELFDFIQQQIEPWSIKEEQPVKEIIDFIDKRIASLNLEIEIPEEIYFIKTTCKEEGGALGYTRSNYIVLSKTAFEGSTDNLQKLIIHELFHVLSRNNESFRAKLYDIIGFQIMNNVEYPKSIKDRRITNPDAPQTDNFIKLKTEKAYVECMMILYSKKDYDGGSFFNYLNIGFLKLIGKEIKEVAFDESGEPIIYSMNEVKSFFEQIGGNTQYIIHPEEILADNFALAIMENAKIKDQWLIDKILSSLSK